MTLEELKRLLHRLSDVESTHIQRLLTGLYGQRKENKALLLFQIVIKRPNISLGELAAEVYSVGQYILVNALVARVYQHVVEGLIMRVSLNKSELQDSDVSEWTRIILLRALLHAHIVQQSGLRADAFTLFSRVAEQAQAAALHDIQLQASLACQALDVHSTDFSASHIRSIWAILDTEVATEIAANEAECGQDAQTNIFEERKKEQIAANTAAVNSYSPRAEAHRLRLQYLQAKQEPHQDIVRLQTLTDKMQSLSLQYPTIYNNKLHTTFALHNAEVALLSFDFEAAMQTLQAILDRNTRFAAAVLPAQLQMIRILVYKGEYSTVPKLLRKIQQWVVEHPPFSRRMPESAQYIAACAHFLEGNPRAARQMLDGLLYLMGDKSGANKQIRVLEILCAIELGEDSLAAGRIETQRKHLSRYGGNERDWGINRFFRSLERHSFRFTKLTDDMQQHLATIKKTKWDALSLECINTAVWIESKIRRVSYSEQFKAFAAAERLRILDNESDPQYS